MSTLHTVNKSPFEHRTLASCARVCLAGDGLLLIEDGVYGALATAPTSGQFKALRDKGVKLLALSEDVRARGLEGRLTDSVELTDYAGFVRLSCEHHSIQSWY